MTVILDTGPLVALIDRRDFHHQWAKQAWSRMDSSPITCEAVVTEACFILRALPVGVAAVLQMLNRGRLEMPFFLASESGAVLRLMDKYRDVPMSLADACLVRMSELYPPNPVFTLDSDFNIYKRNRREVIPTLSPH